MYTCSNPACPERNPQPRSHYYSYSGGCRKTLCIPCYKRKVSERTRKDRPNSTGKRLGSKYDKARALPATDYLLCLCEFCILDDCCRPEGAYRAGNYPAKQFTGCLVWACELARLDSEQVGEAVRVILTQLPTSVL